MACAWIIPMGCAIRSNISRACARAAPNAWIMAEKILQPGESLRANWPIDGTTGYDFLNVCNGLLVHGEGLRRDRTEFTRNSPGEQRISTHLRYAQEAGRGARGAGQRREPAGAASLWRFARTTATAAITREPRFGARFARLPRASRSTEPMLFRSADEITEEDRGRDRCARRGGQKANGPILTRAVRLYRRVLALRDRGELGDEFLLRFQQFTSPVMAKGVEDTAFYCFNRMIGLNEVGGVAGARTE